METVELGTISEAERDEIESIYTRKIALVDLTVSLGDRGMTSNDLYERLVADMGVTQQRMRTWWDNVAARYNWSYEANDSWSVDFKTRAVRLQVGGLKGAVQ